VDDTWFSRELPVLEAVGRALEENDRGALPDVKDIVSDTGKNLAEVVKALEALDGEYLELRRSIGNPSSWYVPRIYPEARRAVGQWPTGENLAERVIAAIDDAAERASDPETKSRLRRLGETLGGATKEILTKTLAEVVARQVGA